MTIDWSKPIETTCGLKAKVISDDYRTMSNKKVRVIQIEAKYTSLTNCVSDDGCGGLYKYRNIKTKTKHEGWINIYRNGVLGGIYREKPEVDWTGGRRVACVKVEWEEE